MMTRSNNTPFWLLLVGIALVLMSRSLLSEGMFVDGVTYASISRNMAEGQGTFWNPHYTQTLYPEFRQHPPLALGMEALLFKALGDHLFVERLYSVLMFVISALLIVAIWKRTTNKTNWAWLPLLFWIAIPLTTWSATNNLLENTMTVFVLLSVYLMLLSYQFNAKIWLALSAIPLLCAFLSKGFTGLFPLAFPLIYCIFDKKRHWIQGPIDSILLTLAFIVMSGLMFLFFPPSLAYLKDYINFQVIGGALYEVTANSRFYIVSQFLLQMLAPIGLLLMLFVLRKTSKTENVKVFEFPLDKSWFFTFLILGLTGVLPIILSVKQRDFYMLAALPFFALALGHLTLAMAQVILLKIQKKCHKWLLIGSSCVLLTGLVLTFAHIGKYNRDEAFLTELKEVLKEIPEHETVGIATKDFTQWSWHAYFMRYGKVSLDDQAPHEYSFSYNN